MDSNIDNKFVKNFITKNIQERLIFEYSALVPLKDIFYIFEITKTRCFQQRVFVIQWLKITKNKPKITFWKTNRIFCVL